MESLMKIMLGTQFLFMGVMGIFFMMQYRNTKPTRVNVHKDTAEKLQKMQDLRKIKLNEPLTEKMRPKTENDIVGQEEGIRALKNALCTPNPQHIIIYGSPGIGKTAAARMALETAKKSSISSFSDDAQFVELDATTLRFDERSVADPLMGSVHDPIYQGAGSYGSAGIPQPKSGAVTKAHGGVLFIDEIGELNPIQMNKLLKVLEDRKVMLESSYYAATDDHIPSHIHDIFQNGLPADFRLIGATTRSREDIPPALRSRCVEIFFKDLSQEDLYKIIENTIENNKIEMEEESKKMITEYANNGRDVVTILQTAYNKTLLENHSNISVEDIEWVLKSGGYVRQMQKKVKKGYYVGKVNGLGVMGANKGMLLEVEAIVKPVSIGKGSVKITGIIEEEQLRGQHSTTKRKSMAQSSLENVLTLLQVQYDMDLSNYYVHVNFPSGVPVDGPSAGCAMFCALYSALTNQPIPENLAITGEITIHGEVYPVGGVPEKIAAAQASGVKGVIIPKSNMQSTFNQLNIDIIPITKIEELVECVWGENVIQTANQVLHA
ncbi:MAG: ATP-dependent protease LonB [Cellulosilyticaceae bacterium]